MNFSTYRAPKRHYAKLLFMNLSLVASSSMSGPERQAFADRARRLARRLSEYSQASVAAGWLNDLEFMVWQDLEDRRLVDDLLLSPEGNVLPRLSPNAHSPFVDDPKASRNVFDFKQRHQASNCRVDRCHTLIAEP